MIGLGVCTESIMPLSINRRALQISMEIRILSDVAGIRNISVTRPLSPIFGGFLSLVNG